MPGALVTFRIIWSTSKRDAKKFTFHMMTIGLPFYYPALSASEPMIISEITAAHKKAIRKGPSLDSSKRH